MSVSPLILRSFMSLLGPLILWPAPTVATILYYGRALPRSSNLERLVCVELLRGDNYLFHFFINMLRCFW